VARLAWPSILVLYEYPFNEGIRTMLRLEQLFDRLGQLLPRDPPLDHHFAIATVFEIMDVAARADLKSDLLKDLERHRAQLQGYRGNPHISEAALDGITSRIDRCHERLNALPGKAGQALTGNDWLMSVRSRIGIPGGTCEFDLPSYFAWQQHSAERRRADLVQWTSSLMPLAEALHLLLGLLRDSGAAQRQVAVGGHFQLSLPVGRTYQLMRVQLDAGPELVPELSGHRLMVAMRLLHWTEDGRLRPHTADTTFELTLCA
jgi:cell division protein ZapD